MKWHEHDIDMIFACIEFMLRYKQEDMDVVLQKYSLILK